MKPQADWNPISCCCCEGLRRSTSQRDPRRGAGYPKVSASPVGGGKMSLDIPFYRTSVSRGEVNRESVPDLAAHLHSEGIRHGLRRWMLRLSMTRWMVLASRYCRASSQAARANSLSRRTSASRLGGRGRADVRIQRDWLLIQAHHRFGWIVWFFVGPHHVFHPGDVLVIEFGHTPNFFPATA